MTAETTLAGRVRHANRQAVRPDRAYVLYWMIAARRPSWNLALEVAIDAARHFDRPLIVLEALEVDYPWASDRLHRFVLDGMAHNAEAFAAHPVTYHPYVEPEPGAGRGLLAALAAHACLVVTDEFPSFFLPKIVAAAAARVDAALLVVDGNGLLPLSSADREFSTAASFRRFVQRTLPEALQTMPRPDPFGDVRLPRLDTLPRPLEGRWPAAPSTLLRGEASALRQLPIDHDVPAVGMRGGAHAATAALTRFVADRLPRYHDRHNEPEADVTSRLSPYLHFGHMSAHEVFSAVMAHERWSPRRLSGKRATGAREGWWSVSPSAERFLDQLVVWRELSYNTCARRPHDYDTLAAVPEWARLTLRAHRLDHRPHLYDRDTLERGLTDDALWNAAQHQLRREGWFHNYMRLLWGKKILEWSKTPHAALATMIAIMNRWSLDGRNPNSFAGYLWTLGRYDRPWPERPVFGTVRTMSSVNTARKVATRQYIATYAPDTNTGSPGPNRAPAVARSARDSRGRRRNRRAR